MHKPIPILNQEEETRARQIAMEQLRPLHEVRREIIREKKRGELVFSLPLTVKERKALACLLQDSLINGGFCSADKDRIVSLLGRVVNLQAQEETKCYTNLKQ